MALPSPSTTGLSHNPTNNGPSLTDRPPSEPPSTTPTTSPTVSPSESPSTSPTVSPTHIGTLCDFEATPKQVWNGRQCLELSNEFLEREYYTSPSACNQTVDDFLCAENHYVGNKECKPCSEGFGEHSIRSAGDDPLGLDTTCTITSSPTKSPTPNSCIVDLIEDHLCDDASTNMDIDAWSDRPGGCITNGVDVVWNDWNTGHPCGENGWKRFTSSSTIDGCCP